MLTLSSQFQPSLDEREAGSGGHPTHIVLIPGHLHKPVLAPPRAPAVLGNYPAFSLVELLHYCALIGRELLSVEIFSCTERSYYSRS